MPKKNIKGRALRRDSPNLVLGIEAFSPFANRVNGSLILNP